MINRRTVYRRMIKIKRLSQLLIVFCMATAACAQDSLDEYRKQVQSEYQGFAREAREEYANFRDRANAEYGKFMQEPWQAAEVLPPDPVPVRPGAAQSLR